MLLEELAADMVKVTSALIGGRTINIMNTDGIIIASSENDRVGTFHQGALEAVQTGKAVNIRKDQLAQYPGAKEGCNMPLQVNGTIIGVVGIYGEPDKIRDVAHLLEVYVSKYYQLEAMLRPRLSESALRSQLLISLLSPPNKNLSAAQNLAETLNMHFTFPVYTVVISAPGSLSLTQNSQPLQERLDSLNLLHKHCDVWGTVDQRMVLLCSTVEDRDITELRRLNDWGYRVSLGSPCNTLWEIHTSYEQASILDFSTGELFNDIRTTQSRCNYRMGLTAIQEEAFIQEMYQKLLDAFGPNDCAMLLESARAYYDHDRSVCVASQELFIHKNTLQYRMRRILEVLEVSKLPHFWQEYMVRLIIEHTHRKSRS